MSNVTTPAFGAGEVPLLSIEPKNVFPNALKFLEEISGQSRPLTSIFAVALVGFLTWTLFYRLNLAFGSSLRNIPGPWHAKFTGLGLKWHDVWGSRWYYILDLHEKYGPVVRVAAEEISLCDPADVKKLHGLGTTYRKRQQPGTPYNIFSMSEPRAHRARQTFYAKAFSGENIDKNLQPFIQKLTEMAVDGMREDSTKLGAADMFKWSNIFGYDVAWQLVYNNAETEGLIAKKAGVDQVLTGCHLQLANSLMLFCFPVFLIGRMLAIPIPALRDYFRPDRYYDDLCIEGPRQAEIGPKTSFWSDTGNLSKYEQKGDSFIIGRGIELTKFDVTRDSTTFLGAGGQAVGTTILFLIWAVLKDPQLQAKLEEEVATVEGPLTNDALADLPYLNGTLYETLRLYGGGASHLPRYSDRAVDFSGFTVPPGVAVTSHHGPLHRNPKAWERPLEFDPLRWQNRSQSMISDEFQPFNSGARACIAIHLVMVQMRIFIAAFFKEFRGVHFAPSVTDENMKILDRFHIQPYSKSMEVVIPVKN